ncbi:MAG: AraC family transcriptional regulator [Deltaproteobacteria bacterium]|nr:MAG: AraC family transcriptional regulator [Deltaproteobacteria bacterium]
MLCDCDVTNVREKEQVRLNKTATKQISESPSIWVGRDLLLFEGQMGFLEWHQHGFACLLMGTGGAFEVEFGSHKLSCEVFFVPAGLRHQLEFRGQAMCSMYIPPHHPDFFSLQAHSRDVTLRTTWTESWRDALEHWRSQRDPGVLMQQALLEWGCDDIALDARVLRLVRTLAEGEFLNADREQLSDELGLSASRLTHLVKDSLGVNLQRVKRAYRFSRAAVALAYGASLTEAAHVAGFADAAHFSRSFRAAYGLPPSHAILSSTSWELLEGE